AAGGGPGCPKRRIRRLDAAAAARAWIEGWTTGWQNADPEPIAALYAEDAAYVSHPNHALDSSPSDYALRSFGDEVLVECHYGEPVVGGDRAAVEYWAIL